MDAVRNRAGRGWLFLRTASTKQVFACCRNPVMAQPLDELREQLNDVDQRLIEAVAERQRIVAQISASKIASGRSTRDYQREKAVIQLARSRAHECGVDPDVAESLMSTLIRTSLTSQERARVAATGAGSGQCVLIIGGSGKMGGWFTEFFQSQGFDVTVADPREPTIPCRHVHDWRGRRRRFRHHCRCDRPRSDSAHTVRARGGAATRARVRYWLAEIAAA